MSEFRVLVTGSRTWTDYGRIYRRLAELASADDDTRSVVVIHGCAGGADSLADHAARELGYEVREYPADWTFGAEGGKTRNTQMLREEDPHVVLAFWKDDSPGTGDCVEKALDQGHYVEIHEQ